MKTCLIAALSLMLMACAGSSPRIDSSQLGALQKGQTTVSDVVRQFGRPSILSKNPDGTQTAYYVHSNEPSGTTTMVPLISTAPVESHTFYFDTQGVLTDYKATQARAATPAPGDAAKPVQASTDKSAPANTNKAASSDAGKTAQGSTNKTTQDSAGGWSFLVPPSATKQNR